MKKSAVWHIWYILFLEYNELSFDTNSCLQHLSFQSYVWLSLQGAPGDMGPAGDQGSRGSRVMKQYYKHNPAVFSMLGVNQICCNISCYINIEIDRFKNTIVIICGKST